MFVDAEKFIEIFRKWNHYYDLVDFEEAIEDEEFAPAVIGWHPISKGMPKKAGEYLFSSDLSYVFVGFFDGDTIMVPVSRPVAEKAA